MTKDEYREIVAQANVLHSLDEILERSAILRDLYEDGRIGLVGGMYNVDNGQVSFVKKMFAGTGQLVGEAANV